MIPHRCPPVARSAFSLLLVATLAASPALADGPKGADWISADAVAVLEVARPSAILDRLTGEPLKGLLDASPDFQKYLASDDYARRRAVVDAIAGQLGTTWDKALVDLAGGGLIVAVEPGSPPKGILIATPGDRAFLDRAVEKAVELGRADAASKGKPDPFTPGEHRGIKGFGVAPKGAFAVVDGALVVADSTQTLQGVVDRMLDHPGPIKTLAGDPLYRARRKAHLSGDAVAWAMVRVDGVRKIDPNAFKAPSTQGTPLAAILFGDWIEAVRKAPWVSAGLAWSPDHLGATLAIATPPGGHSDAYKRFRPGEGKGAPGLLRPKGTIASVGLWRDLSSIWEVRSELFTPQVVQGLAQLDTFAGTFFGGRDFGTGVLGALGTDWRLVVARQDPSTLDPTPDVKLPAFALIADLKPDDEEFAVRLKAAYQSFIGLANLGAAQTKAPPLMIGNETVDGVVLSTARFLKPSSKDKAKPSGPVHVRHNFSPTAAQVGNHFVIGSGVGIVRDLVPILKDPPPATAATLLIEADGDQLAALIDENAARLVMQNMLEKGNDKPRAESEVATLARIVRALGKGTLGAVDAPDSVRLQLDFATKTP